LNNFNPGDSIPNYTDSPGEKNYYGGVTATGDGAMKADGTQEWTTNKATQAVTDSFINNPKEPISPDAPFIQASQDVQSRADTIIGKTGQMQCEAQQINRSEFTNYSCERDIQVEQACTRTAEITGNWTEGWETRFVTISPGSFSFQPSGNNALFSFQAPVTGNVVWATLNVWVASNRYLWNMPTSFMNTSFNLQHTASIALSAAGMTLSEGQIVSGLAQGTLVNAGNLFNTQFVQEKSSTFTLEMLMNVKTKVFNPTITWTESCPFSKSEGTLKNTECIEPGSTKTVVVVESSDRFTLVQGYAGVGKTTQFRAVMSAIGTLPEEQRPRVIGVAPTHRAVSEMRDAGVPESQTLAAFIHDTQQQLRGGEKPDFRNVLFLVDESSMVGNADMARAYGLIAGGGGRAVSSGDTDQLQSIAPGQPFRLLQKRSAIDVAVMQEIVRQTPALKPAVYSLIDRDIDSALNTLEQVAPAQVPRQAGAWQPESSVVEFGAVQEKDIEKGLADGSLTPGAQPATLYEAIVRDYTGRTPQAQAQTIVVTTLNADRRALNAQIHEARQAAGELGEQEARLPVLTSANLRDGELRKMATWQAAHDNLVLLDSTYYRIDSLDKEGQLVTLKDEQGNTRSLSPTQAVTEGVTLYRPDTLTVSPGDRMRFSKSDNERGFVANSVWTVSEIDGDRVTLSDGHQTRTVNPAAERAEQHIDLAYAVTAHGAQGASEPFAIALQGTEGARKAMVSFESAYVALSRMKQHAQVYTDDRAAWVEAMGKSRNRSTAHDILEPRGDRAVSNAERLMGTAKPLGEVAAGRAVLRQAGLSPDGSMARFISPGRKYPQPHVALPAFDGNGKPAGIWLSSLMPVEGEVRGLTNEGRVMGSEAATFAGLQVSRNGESLLAADMPAALKLARENPHSGVVVRLPGSEGRPWNPGAITGGRIWADGVSNDVVTGTQHGEKLPPEVVAQQAQAEQQRREMEERAAQAVREMARGGDKGREGTDPVREVARELERTQEPTPDAVRVLDNHEERRRDNAVAQVANENVQRERLQQMEREVVRDLDREKTLSGD
jgi:plastocyanin